ncbi:unnamed protein product [Candidula unifasciata]|uniref:Paraoxonase n=1 Tax=Candidula unifasciata TaxID=100452 RepID=A0A8S3ZLG1_9EUPU|nr:unnamed protein product [Candidula unifasciata]
MIGGAVKVALVAIIVYRVARSFLNPPDDVFKKHYPGKCSQVKGLNFGSEDLEVTKNGLAFVTSGVWFPTVSNKFDEFLKSNNIQGNIFLYDFNQPDLGARKLKLIPSKDFDPETFHPHGISLLEDETNGEHLLYVVSHPKHADDAVEKFRYSPKTNELIHLKSFTGDVLHITNDLTVLEEDKFYISNFLYFKNPYLSIAEHVFSSFGFGSLVFFNGTAFSVVKQSMNSPNGLFLSKDKRILYNALPREQSVKAFEIKSDYSLTEIQSVVIGTSPDNLHLSNSGDALYTGAHPVIPKIIQHLGDPRQPSPSSVLKLPLKDGKIVPEEIVELFYDHGNLISGSSVAAVYNNKLLIGSVINKLVICDANTAL